MSAILNRKIFILLIVAVSALSLAQYAGAYESEWINNFATLKFSDSGPVTTPINVRFSVWQDGIPDGNDSDISGNINISDKHFGGWQYVKNYTPAPDGTVGINLLDPAQFPDFPEIFGQSAFLQVEFKYPSETNSSYRMVDMIQDSPDIMKRYLLVNSLNSISPATVQGGTDSESFTIDYSSYAEQFVKLIFGQAGKSITYDLLSNWFNLDGRLNINGFPGVKLAINADASDSNTQLVSVRNGSGSPVFYINENGDATGSTLTATNSLALPAGSGASAPILKHLSVRANNVISASILAANCSDYATISVPGAAVGDSVVATPTAASGGIETVDLSWNAFVSSADHVIIRACNPTLLSDINTANTQGWRVDVWGH